MKPPNSTFDLPITLRPETSGGIVYDPYEGVTLELDHEAYEVARQALTGTPFFINRKKRHMFFDLKKRLHINRFRKAREISLPKDSDWRSRVPIPTFRSPTLVDFQITQRCDSGCPHCYANATPDGKHVPWEELTMVIKQLRECGVCQLAIGGGEPLMHPRLIDLLKLCHENEIVPNLTTSGTHMNDEILKALQNYCGAVGVSMEYPCAHFSETRSYGFKQFEETLDKLQEFEIPSVIQIALSPANIKHLEEMVDFCLTRELYGVIFLAHKPVGRGETYSETLASLDQDTVIDGLSRAFKCLSHHSRVGYDCCMTPGIAGVEDARSFVDVTGLEGCSGLRGSVGISPELDVLPCTFAKEWKLGNLRDKHLLDVWHGETAEKFRATIYENSSKNQVCTDCSKLEYCYAGCPIMPLINCHKDFLKK